MTACGSRERAAPDASQRQPLLIAAAADLANLQKPLLEAFASVGAAHAEFVLGSSGILARQIEQGAPYDVYLSANQEYVRALAQSGRLDAATVRVYAVGRVGLWSRGHQVKELKELASDAVVHVSMPNPAHAPYGVAAREALEEAGLWTKVESKVVYGENVRQALQYAESGNAEVTLTAWSLIHDRGGVLLPAELYTPVLQAGAAVRGSKRAEVARRFLEFLTGPDGQRILRSGGFGPPPTP